MSHNPRYSPKTNAFLVVSVSDETKGYKSHANREKGIPSLLYHKETLVFV